MLTVQPRRKESLDLLSSLDGYAAGARDAGSAELAELAESLKTAVNRAEHYRAIGMSEHAAAEFRPVKARFEAFGEIPLGLSSFVETVISLFGV